MKAKYINEKFTEDSDPVRDMGIGLLSEVKEWYHQVTNQPWKNINSALITAAAYGKIKYAKILLDLGANINTTYANENDGPLFYAISNGEEKMAKFLLKRGAKTQHILFNHYGDVADDLIKCMKELKMPIPKKINEKFTEDGDPIHDMGIGMIKHLHAIRKELEDENFEISWESIDENKKFLTLQLDSYDYVDVENFNSKGKKYYDWNEIGISGAFNWIYYIDIDLIKNKVKRSSNFTHSDIDGFDYWDRKILCKDAMNTSTEEIIAKIIDDWFKYDVSNAAEEAWDIAETNY